MISTHKKHYQANPAALDALVLNNQIRTVVQHLASFCNVCAASVATTPILMHTDVIRTFIEIQDELNDVVTSMGEVQELIATAV